MRKKLSATLVISLFILLTTLSAAPANGVGQGEWITNYTIRDLRTQAILEQRDFQTSPNTATPQLLGGAELDITITVRVPITVPDSSLTLTTNMQHSTVEDRYWELAPGYPLTNYNPNSATVTFSQNEGTLVISCFGMIPQGMTETTVGGTVMHNNATSVLIALNGPSGELLDQIKVDVIDAKISEYRSKLAQRESELQALRDQGVSEAYLALYANIVSQSRYVADQGFTDNAIGLLDSLTVAEAPPATVGASMADTLFLPSVIGLAVAAVLVAFLFVRARGKASYVSSVVEDQIRDLEGLTVRAAKVDRNLASGLETIEDRLKRAVGE